MCRTEILAERKASEWYIRVFTVIEIIGSNSVQSRRNPTRPVRYLNADMYTRTQPHRICDSYLYMDLSEYDNDFWVISLLLFGPLCASLCVSKWIFRAIEYDENRIESNQRLRGIKMTLLWRRHPDYLCAWNETVTTNVHATKHFTFKWTWSVEAKWSTHKCVCVRRQARSCLAFPLLHAISFQAFRQYE